jgi:quercetin 2,3-dioxygenase
VITLRRAGERGHADLGWLSSYHTFSFADYYDPAHMGFRALRVINQDRVQGGHGFPMHPHREMEIISYVLEGALEHEDTMGQRAVLRPGEVQVISAGTGMAHSEYNPSPETLVHFLQIWIIPQRRGVAPRYQQRDFPDAERQGRLRLVASGSGRDGSLSIYQDAEVYATVLGPGETASLPLAPGRHAWVHVARGALRLNGERLEAGDGAALDDEAELTLTGEPAASETSEPAEAVVFDLA